LILYLTTKRVRVGNCPLVATLVLQWWLDSKYFSTYRDCVDKSVHVWRHWCWGLFWWTYLFTVANVAFKLILRFAAIEYVFCLHAGNRSSVSVSSSLLVRKNLVVLINTSWPVSLGIERRFLSVRFWM